MSLSLADATFWVAVVCCVVAQYFILRGTIAASAPHTPGAATPGAATPGATPAARRSVEIAWAIVPAAGLALVLAATWRAMHPAPSAASTPAPEHTAAQVREVPAA